MKIGNLEFKDYAAQKPLTVSPSGDFLTASEVVSQPTLSLGSVFTLDTDQQLKVAVKRYEYEPPELKIGVIGAGLFTRDEVIEQLNAQTDFGKLALRAEMGYVNELTSELMAGASLPSWPSIPDSAIPDKPDWRRRKRCIWLKLPRRALFCEDTKDPVTTPFANYRMANVHPVFQNRGFTVVVLQGSDDVRINFVPQAKKSLTIYLGGIGHGSYTTYTGYWGDHILEVGHYDAAEVKDKAIHFLSCKTGAQLGPDAVAQGAYCYAGYTENFVLQWDDGTTPAVDEFELFAKSDSTFDIMMAHGATGQQAYDATIQAFNAAISQVPNTAAATFLTWDRNHLRLHGDPETTIPSHRYVKICFPVAVLEHQDALAEAGELAD